MSLFGALSSGVSGLTAQSSAMGAISDNITNVSTVGYKNTSVNFQSLVTKQTSSTFYSAGGVQSKPRQDTGVQGLLQASTSQTDIAISGQGFFVVNEAASPTVDDQFLYTRSGSFFMDNEGFLRNTSGFYLQGWPTSADGTVKPANSTLTIANQNIVSTDYLSTVNLNRVGGTASSTSTIGIGANLPSNDTAGTEHKTDVQFFDSLGNANTMSVIYERATAENEWKISIEPPQGTTHITLEDSTTNPKVYRSVGQLEFNTLDSTGAARRPADGASMTITQGGTTKTYVFDSNSSVTNATAQVSTTTIAQTATVFQTDTIQTTRGTGGAADAGDTFSITINGTTATYTAVAGDTTDENIATGLKAVIDADATLSALVSVATNGTGLMTLTAKTVAQALDYTTTPPAITSIGGGTADSAMGAATNTVAVADVTDGDTVTATINGTVVTYTFASDTLASAAAGLAAAINANTTVNTAVVATATAGVVSITSLTPGTAFTFASAEGVDADADMTVTAATTTANAGTAGTYKVDISASTTLAGDVAALLASIRTNDPNVDTTNNRVSTSPGSSTTLLFEDDGLSSMTIDPTGLKDSTGAAVTTQVTSYTVDKRDTLYTDTTQIKFSTVPATGDTLKINGITYTFTSGEAEDSTGADTVIYRDGPLDRVLADLEAAIEANDPDFSGDSVIIRATNSPANNTLVLSSLTNGNNYTVVTTGLTVAPTEPDGSSTVDSSIYTATGTITVGTEPAISFSSDGLPNAFNVVELDIRNFANGAANMDDDASNASQITLDFGTLTEANGMTQFGAAFTPVFINQNGSRFGTFAGVTVSADGLVTALFDNGETRPIYKLPIATFVNVNGLESRTGNTWNATEASGDYTLRTADNGPAGQTVQGTLEASTVDIGEEFTDMIVVQRAYSASAKIISTADQMLEELMRVKR
ncbi:MAG: flagellar hook-basal body complex protein [Rhodospirillales bacterium]|nr:flagellar hook-basal body complex protein [Rhodospirillales bacterium]